MSNDTEVQQVPTGQEPEAAEDQAQQRESGRVGPNVPARAEIDPSAPEATATIVAAPVEEEPVSIPMAPKGFTPMTARRGIELRDEPGEGHGALLAQVESGESVGRGKLELERNGRVYVTATYKDKAGWVPADLLADA
jgi:hypothetical protein